MTHSRTDLIIQAISTIKKGVISELNYHDEEVSEARAFARQEMILAGFDVLGATLVNLNRVAETLEKIEIILSNRQLPTKDAIN